MKLAALVTAVPARLPHVYEFLATIDAERLVAPALVVIDAQYGRSPWATTRRGLVLADADTETRSADWLLRFQDDVIAGPHLLATLERVLALVPATVAFASLWIPGDLYTAMGGVALTEPSLVPVRDWVSGPAFAIRTEQIAPMLAWADEHVPDGFRHDDYVTSEYANSGAGAVCLVPCLTEHLDGPSEVYGRSFGERVAYRFTDADLSEADWQLAQRPIARDTRRRLRFPDDSRHVILPTGAVS